VGCDACKQTMVKNVTPPWALRSHVLNKDTTALLLAMSVRVLGELWLSLPVASGSGIDTQYEDFLHLLWKS
jgi:hypothetical protein